MFDAHVSKAATRSDLQNGSSSNCSCKKSPVLYNSIHENRFEHFPVSRKHCEKISMKFVFVYIYVGFINRTRFPKRKQLANAFPGGCD